MFIRLLQVLKNLGNSIYTSFLYMVLIVMAILVALFAKKKDNNENIKEHCIKESEDFDEYKKCVEMSESHGDLYNKK